MSNRMADETPLNVSRRWKVLIVDDVQDVRDSFRELLEGEGYEVIDAADGVAALAILRASRYPLVVLLDMTMPLMRGDSVIEALISERMLPGKHAILLLTASPSTVPRPIRAVLLKYEIPIVSKTVPLEEIVEQVERASARINYQQGKPR